MSETSSNWPRDELVFVDELRRHGEPRSKGEKEKNGVFIKESLSGMV